MSASSGHSAQWRDWSGLPAELLERISSRVTDIVDYIPFRGVCKSWRSAASPVNLPHQTPWLLLPYFPGTTVRRFHIPSKRRIVRFDLPDFLHRAIYPSSNGWLLMTDIALSFSFLNPFTGAHIHLPPIPDRDTAASFCKTLEHNTYYFKCHTFTAPGGQPAVAIFVTRSIHTSSHFFYCRGHDEYWTEPTLASNVSIHAIEFHRGRFYIIHNNLDVEVCNLSSDVNPVLIPSLTVPIPPLTVSILDDTFYILASSATDLLLVTNTMGPSRTGKTRVSRLGFYKLDREQLKWSEVEGIGDYALFVTDTEYATLLTASADGASGCKTNFIYKAYWPRNCRIRKLDLNRIENRLSTFLSEDENCTYGQMFSSWFTPGLSLHA